MAARLRHVAVLGAGPCGASLAAYLARAGVRVTLFARPDRPPLIVGESLLPAVIPLLRELGIEDEVRGFSTYKPGATFVYDTGFVMSFCFAESRKPIVDYAYNVPRDRFDDAILQSALRAGAELVPSAAEISREEGSDVVSLRDATLERAGLREQPDFIVDASGRSRLFARTLKLPSHVGTRQDLALQAHLEGAEILVEGNIHLDRLARGWSWRIPLPGRVSVGLVMDADHLAQFGISAQQQYDRYLESDPVCKAWSSGARRITPVMRYTNYQLWTERGIGANWAMVGDAFGFVDPALSSGVMVGMTGARALAKALLAPGFARERALRRYERSVHEHLAGWRKVVSYFYDGRLLTMFKVGEEFRHTRAGRVLDPHFRTYLPRIFTGEGMLSAYSRGLIDALVTYGLAGNDPDELAIR